MTDPTPRAVSEEDRRSMIDLLRRLGVADPCTDEVTVVYGNEEHVSTDWVPVEEIVNRLISHGWGPKPADETITEHAVLMSGGSMQVRPNDEDDVVYPYAEWVANRRRYGDRVFTRKVIVVEDWIEVTDD